MKVLVIDDSEDIRDLSAVILESAGLQVLVAESGRLGVEMAIEHKPALILLDVFMEGWSGEETLANLQQSIRTAAIPVAFLTGETRPATLERLSRLGVSGFVAKPFTPVTLIREVKALLAGVEPEARSESGESLLDEAVLAQLQQLADEDDPDFLTDLVEAFIHDATSIVAVIDDASRKNDRDVLVRQSHVLKSSSGNVGASALSCAAQTLESRGGDATGEELIALVKKLTSLLIPSSVALRTFRGKV